jgi:hypothetical protein
MSNEVAVKDEAALPSYLQDYKGTTGREDIETSDVSIPRIKLGQSMSEEVKSGDVKEGALFLNVTGEVLAEPGEPLRFIPVIAGKEFILWKDRNDDGGGILARAHKTRVNGEIKYAWDKPEETFANRVGGKIKVEWKTGKYCTEKRLADELLPGEDNLGAWGSEIPGDETSGIAATAHFNYVVVLPDHGNMVAALSLSRSQAKRARDLNGILKMSEIPIFARVIRVNTVDDNKGDDKFKNVKFRPAGLVQDEETFEFTKGLHEHFAKEGFVVDQRDEDSGVDDASNDEKAF